MSTQLPINADLLSTKVGGNEDGKAWNYRKKPYAVKRMTVFFWLLPTVGGPCGDRAPVLRPLFDMPPPLGAIA